MQKPPVLVLAILDGWGLSEHKQGNAVAQAQSPTFEKLYHRYPWVSLEASGQRVGLPQGQEGNSEVGHLSIGSGRVVYQNITRINQSIASGKFFQNGRIRQLLQVGRSQCLHLLGLVSDGGVHSHMQHLIALLHYAKQEGVDQVFIHAFTDGRDTSPRVGHKYLQRLETEIRRIGVGQVASVSGRYYAMDRDNRWNRTEKAYRAIVEGWSRRKYRNPLEGVDLSYRDQVNDEFIEPFVTVDENGQPVGRLLENHAAIFFNFRADRSRQLTRALTLEEFDDFKRKQPPTKNFLTLTEYDPSFKLPMAFPSIPIHRVLANLFAEHEIKNLRLAETEKCAHVSYFFNGGQEQPFPGEERILIPSPQVSTYDLRPEMSASEITDRLLYEIDRRCYQVVVLNFANADMVGHTGDLEATIRAVEAIDECMALIYQKVQRIGGVIMITADHGNAEKMIDPMTGQIHTAHTANPVPFILVDDHCGERLRQGGAIEDIAPTVLQYLEIEKPSEMTGNSLLVLD